MSSRDVDRFSAEIPLWFTGHSSSLSILAIVIRYKGFMAVEVSADDLNEYRDLLGGLVSMHVLHHASEEEIYGAWMIEELAGHGYRLSAGTLYPMLHKMVRNGYLTVRTERNGRTARKLYAATDKGRRGLAVAREQMRIFTRKDPEA